MRGGTGIGGVQEWKTGSKRWKPKMLRNRLGLQLDFTNVRPLMRSDQTVRKGRHGGLGSRKPFENIIAEKPGRMSRSKAR